MTKRAVKKTTKIKTIDKGRQKTAKKAVLGRRTVKKKLKPAKSVPGRRMIEIQLDLYKEKLINMRDEVLSEVRELSENVLTKSQKEITGDLSNHSLHMADIANDSFEKDFSINLASNEMHIISQIDSALRKIEEGDFGICENCQKPIPKIRLDALPYVVMCKKCQEELESRQ